MPDENDEFKLILDYKRKGECRFPQEYGESGKPHLRDITGTVQIKPLEKKQKKSIIDVILEIAEAINPEFLASKIDLEETTPDFRPLIRGEPYLELVKSEGKTTGKPYFNKRYKARNLLPIDPTFYVHAELDSDNLFNLIDHIIPDLGESVSNSDNLDKFLRDKKVMDAINKELEQRYKVNGKWTDEFRKKTKQEKKEIIKDVVDDLIENNEEISSIFEDITGIKEKIDKLIGGTRFFMNLFTCCAIPYIDHLNKNIQNQFDEHEQGINLISPDQISTTTSLSSVYMVRDRSDLTYDGKSAVFSPSMKFNKEVKRTFNHDFPNPETVGVYRFEDNDILPICNYEILETSTKMIGPEGGTISTSYVTQDIPAGALTSLTEITIQDINLDCGTCKDDTRNNGEFGVDCGGPCKKQCPATCDDGLQNGDEQGVDCGGPCTIVGIQDEACGIDTNKDCIIDDCDLYTCETQEDCSQYDCEIGTSTCSERFTTCYCKTGCGDDVCDFNEAVEQSCPKDCMKIKTIEDLVAEMSNWIQGTLSLRTMIDIINSWLTR